MRRNSPVCTLIGASRKDTPLSNWLGIPEGLDLLLEVLYPARDTPASNRVRITGITRACLPTRTPHCGQAANAVRAKNIGRHLRSVQAEYEDLPCSL